MDLKQRIEKLEPVCNRCGGSMTEAEWGRLSYHCNCCGSHEINPKLGTPKDKEPT